MQILSGFNLFLFAFALIVCFSSSFQFNFNDLEKSYLPIESGPVVDGCKTTHKTISKHDLPFIILFYLITEFSEKLICSGSIIDPKWILTDAYCADMIQIYMIKRNKTVYAVPVNGDVFMPEKKGVYEIEKTFPGRRINDEIKASQIYIGLVKLRKGITFDEKVYAIEILRSPLKDLEKVTSFGIANEKCNNEPTFLRTSFVTTKDPTCLELLPRSCVACACGAGSLTITFEGIGMPMVLKDQNHHPDAHDHDTGHRHDGGHYLLVGVMTMLNAVLHSTIYETTLSAPIFGHIFTAMEYRYEWVDKIIRDNTYF